MIVPLKATFPHSSSFGAVQFKVANLRQSFQGLGASVALAGDHPGGVSVDTRVLANLCHRSPLSPGSCIRRRVPGQPSCRTSLFAACSAGTKTRRKTWRRSWLDGPPDRGSRDLPRRRSCPSSRRSANAAPRSRANAGTTLLASHGPQVKPTIRFGRCHKVTAKIALISPKRCQTVGTGRVQRIAMKHRSGKDYKVRRRGIPTRRSSTALRCACSRRWRRAERK